MNPIQVNWPFFLVYHFIDKRLMSLLLPLCWLYWLMGSSFHHCNITEPLLFMIMSLSWCIIMSSRPHFYSASSHHDFNMTHHHFNAVRSYCYFYWRQFEMNHPFILHPGYIIADGFNAALFHCDIIELNLLWTTAKLL